MNKVFYYRPRYSENCRVGQLQLGLGPFLAVMTQPTGSSHGIASSRVLTSCECAPHCRRVLQNDDLELYSSKT